MPKVQYYCSDPDCRVVLNPDGDERIILIAQDANLREGLIYLIRRETDYQVIVPPDFCLTPREAVKLFCPLCQRDLMVAKDIRFAQIERVTEDGRRSTAMFSRVFGENATLAAK